MDRRPMAITTITTTTAFRISAIILAFLFLPWESEAVVESGCDTGHYGRCENRAEALRLKLVAIATILVASMVGVCLPLFSRSVPFLRPDRDLFVVVKSFASGVILATGFMHVLPDSFEMLTSPCLPDEPWHKFPFTAFITMLSTVLTLMVDSFMTTFQNRRGGKEDADADGVDAAKVGEVPLDSADFEAAGKDSALLRHRIVAQVLEMGIVVHSVVIGLSMGTSENPCTIRPLVAALCFHQLFEGMGLGGCILQAEYNLKIKSVMVFFFSITTPFGIALGIALTNVYSENSPTELVVVGVLNATSAGLLIYMALVDLLAADFLGSKLQSKARLQGWAYIAVLLGMGGMSLMAKWA